MSIRVLRSSRAVSQVVAFNRTRGAAADCHSLAGRSDLWSSANRAPLLRPKMPPLSHRHKSTWCDLTVFLKLGMSCYRSSSIKRLSCCQCGRKACVTWFQFALHKARECRCSGRPFDEAHSHRSTALSAVTYGWGKRIKYALISLPIWTALSVYILASLLRRCV